jgi:hypothetical protein
MNLVPVPLRLLSFGTLLSSGKRCEEGNADSPILRPHLGRTAFPLEPLDDRIRPSIRSPTHPHFRPSPPYRHFPRDRPVWAITPAEPAHQHGFPPNLSKRRYPVFQEPLSGVYGRLHIFLYRPAEVWVQRSLLLDAYDQGLARVDLQELGDLGDHRLKGRQLRPRTVKGEQDALFQLEPDVEEPDTLVELGRQRTADLLTLCERPCKESQQSMSSSAERTERLLVGEDSHP